MALPAAAAVAVADGIHPSHDCRVFMWILCFAHEVHTRESPDVQKFHILSGTFCKQCRSTHFPDKAYVLLLNVPGTCVPRTALLLYLPNRSRALRRTGCTCEWIQIPGWLLVYCYTAILVAMLLIPVPGTYVCIYLVLGPTTLYGNVKTVQYSYLYRNGPYVYLQVVLALLLLLLMLQVPKQCYSVLHRL